MYQCWTKRDLFRCKKYDTYNGQAQRETRLVINTQIPTGNWFAFILRRKFWISKKCIEPGGRPFMTYLNAIWWPPTGIISLHFLKKVFQRDRERKRIHKRREIQTKYNQRGAWSCASIFHSYHLASYLLDAAVLWPPAANGGCAKEICVLLTREGKVKRKTLSFFFSVLWLS